MSINLVNLGSGSGGGGGGSGITSINSDATAAQSIVPGTSGTDLTISTSSGVTTVNLPVASATNTGKLASADFTTFNSKVGGTGAAGLVSFWTGTSTQSSDSVFFWDSTNHRLGIGNAAPTVALDITGSLKVSSTSTYGDLMTFNAAPSNVISPGNNTFQFGQDHTNNFVLNFGNGADFTVYGFGTANLTVRQFNPLQVFQQAATGGTAANLIRATAGAHTLWNPNINFMYDVRFDCSATATFLDAQGDLTELDTIIFSARTYAYTSVSHTITDASTLMISGAPIAGANTTLTRSNAIWVKGGTSRFDGNLSFTNQAFISSPSSSDIRFFNSTSVGGLDFVLTTTSATINTVTQNAATLILQNQTFTPGAQGVAVQISPTYVSENFSHTGLFIAPIQNGANTSTLQGILVGMTKATVSSTLATMSGISISTPAITGTVSSSQAILINTQANGNATITRGIVFAATGPQNCVAWGNTAMQYSNASNNIRFVEVNNAGGLDFNLTTTNTTINTVTQNSATIILQNQLMTPGSPYNSVQINTQFASENFAHSCLNISPTQNGTNTQTLSGINISMTKATTATTLANMWGITFGSGSVTGTVTNAAPLRISDQTNGNITTPMGILFTSIGPANCISWGSSALQYASTTNNISFVDSTNAGGLSFSLTPASAQTITSTFGNLILNCPTTNSVVFQVNGTTVSSVNVTEFLQSNGQKVKLTTSAAGAYTVLLTDFIIGKTGVTLGGDIVTLPSAATAGVGKIYVIKDQSGTATTNNINVTASSGNIDGATNKVINLNYGVISVYSDGTNYFTR